MRNLFILALATLSLVACTKTEKCTTEAIINDTPDMISNKGTKLSSFMEVKNIIPLENSDSCLLGETEKVIKRDGIIYVKSKGKPLTLFDKSGKFLNTVGKIGAGPEEYTQYTDFDIDGESVYIMTMNKIQVYSRSGKWIKSISIPFNAHGLCLVKDRMLLFVLGDEHVVHLWTKEGEELDGVLDRNQSLRLCRAISFYKYGDKLLFPMGSSNELLMFDPAEKNTFSHIKYLSSFDLTNEEEARLMEEDSQHEDKLRSSGCLGGLMTDRTHVMFPLIKEDDPLIWVKNLQNGGSQAYHLSLLENDITFGLVERFFYDNVEDDCGFLTYIQPYKLKECLEKAGQNTESPYFEMMQKAVEHTEDESNPILIEYTIKD